MDADELTAAILEQAGSGEKAAAEEATVKFVLFKMGDDLYGVVAEEVQEIMLDLPVHFLPFLPPFVRGLVNRLGEPIAVVDLQCLFSGQPLDGRSFLILKPHVGKVAFLIDSVQDIVTVGQSQVASLSRAESGGREFGRGVIRWAEKEVILLDARTVIEAVKEAVDG